MSTDKHTDNVLSFCFILISIASVTICHKMRRFFLQKSEIIENIIDLISADLAFVLSMATVITSFICVARLLYGYFEETVGEICILIIVYVWSITFPYIPTMCIARHLLIFHFNWLNKILDRHIQIFIRIAMTTYSIMPMILDRNYWNTGIHFFFSGNRNQEKVKPYPNLVTTMIFLSITLANLLHAYTEFKIYKLEDQENNVGTEIDTNSGCVPGFNDMVRALKKQSILLFSIMALIPPIPIFGQSSMASESAIALFLCYSCSLGGVFFPLYLCFTNNQLKRHMLKWCYSHRGNQIAPMAEA